MVAISEQVTADWLSAFDAAVAKGEDLAESIFWRLALEVLPLGVDPHDSRVIAAQDKIRAAVDAQRLISDTE